MCGLRHRAHAKAGSLGLLDLKRLEFARALATDPAVILLDEVAAGLVGEELAEVIALIKKVNATGRSVIVVEHVQQVISEVVDRVLVLSSGKLIAEGTPAEIEANAEVEQIYYGARGARRARRDARRPPDAEAPAPRARHPGGRQRQRRLRLPAGPAGRQPGHPPGRRRQRARRERVGQVDARRHRERPDPRRSRAVSSSTGR